MTVRITMNQTEVAEACAEWLRARGASITDEDARECMSVQLQMDGTIVLVVKGETNQVGGPYR